MNLNLRLCGYPNQPHGSRFKGFCGEVARAKRSQDHRLEVIGRRQAKRARSRARVETNAERSPTFSRRLGLATT
jgi:hypothetical protein